MSTMATVGYGDITPIMAQEKVVSMAGMLVGVTMYASDAAKCMLQNGAGVADCGNPAVGDHGCACVLKVCICYDLCTRSFRKSHSWSSGLPSYTVYVSA